MTRRTLRRGAVTLGLIAGVSALAACGGDGDGGSTTAAEKEVSKGGEVVAFTPATNNNYIATMIDTARKTLEAEGYTLKLFENNFDQSEEDQQVQQYLATGKKPAGFVWFPADNKAGIASARRLSATGVPVVQTNQAVLPEAEEFITAYAGVDDYGNGRVSGESAIKMRDAWKKAGKKLNDDQGNVVVITYPGNYQAGIDRIRGFEDATKDAPFKIVRTIPAGFTSEDSYKAVKPAWATVNGKADFIFAVSEFPAIGAMQAAEESGRKLGDDLGVVSGNCQTNFDLFTSGKTYATAIQSPQIEGETFSKVLIKLMQNGGKTQGPGTKQTLEAGADAAPELPEVPAYNTYMPNPALIGGGDEAHNTEVLDSARLWGGTPQDLCAK
jgi:ABC-type sugar transport system substrate-binding protein